MHFLILHQNPILKLINFQYCVTHGNPFSYCCIKLSAANYTHDQVEITGAMSSVSMQASFAHTTSTGKHGRHLLGKGYNSHAEYQEMHMTHMQ